MYDQIRRLSDTARYVDRIQRLQRGRLDSLRAFKRQLTVILSCDE